MKKKKIKDISQKKNSDEFVASIPNRNFQIFMILQIFFTTAALIHAWTLQYRSNFSPDGFINRISYISADKPWMPPGTDTSALLHLHYFGDWVLNVAYGGILRPYDPSLEIPAQFAPVGLVFFNVAYIIGYKYSYAILLLLTFFIWFKIVRKLLPNFDYLNISMVLFFGVFVTMPALIAFDRGGTQLFCLGLAGLSYLKMVEGKKNVSFILFLLAVSMKPYLIFFILIMLIDTTRSVMQRIKSLFFTAISLVSINLLALTFYVNNLVSGIQDEFNAIARFAGDWGIPWIMDGASMTSFVSKTYEFTHGSSAAFKFMEDFVPFWPRILALIFLVLLIVVLMNKNVIDQVKIILILSTTSLVSPFSGPYTLAWISLAYCYLLAEMQKGFRFQNLNFPNKISLYCLITSIYLGLIPYFGYLPKFSDVSRHVPGNYIYIPFIVFALLVSAINSAIKLFGINSLQKKAAY